MTKFLVSLSLSASLFLAIDGFASSQILAAPGLTFKEPMSGYVVMDDEKVKVEVQFEAIVDDIDQWVADDNHAARIVGSIKVGGDTYAAEGTLALMTPVEGRSNGHYLRYDFKVLDPNSPLKSFYGAKRVHNDAGIDLASDITTLYGKFSGDGVSYDSIMKFNWMNPIHMVKFLSSFKTMNVSGFQQDLDVKVKFMKVYFGGIYEEFFKIAF